MIDGIVSLLRPASKAPAVVAPNGPDETLRVVRQLLNSMPATSKELYLLEDAFYGLHVRVIGITAAAVVVSYFMHPRPSDYSLHHIAATIAINGYWFVQGARFAAMVSAIHALGRHVEVLLEELESIEDDEEPDAEELLGLVEQVNAIFVSPEFLRLGLEHVRIEPVGLDG